MPKFRESELTQNLKNFETKTKIELKIERGFDGKIILEDATVKYDAEYGFINIESKNAKFKINTTLVEEYQNNNDEIAIYMESMILKIKNINK